jgi:hypothetical protein
MGSGDGLCVVFKVMDLQDNGDAHLHVLMRVEIRIIHNDGIGRPQIDANACVEHFMSITGDMKVDGSYRQLLSTKER